MTPCNKLPKSRLLEVNADSRGNRKVMLSSLVGTAVTPARSLSDCFGDGSYADHMCTLWLPGVQPALPRTQVPSCQLLHV